MKNNFKTRILINLSIALFLSSLFFSCNNDLDINGEYEDVTVVYGILNPNNKRQFIRINRSFLTDGNALDAALIADSSNYPYKLNVKILEINKNQQVVNTYFLDTIHMPKEGGVFNVGMQPVYYFDLPNIYNVTNYNILSSDTLFMNPDNTYKLEIQNPVSGKIIESTTPLIPSVSVQRPAFFSTIVGFTSDTKTNVEFKSVSNGRIYQAKFIFYYREIDIVNNPNDTILKELEWNLGTVKSNFITGGESLIIPYIPYSFFNQLRNRVPVNSNILRYHGKFVNGSRVDIQFVMSIGADELNTYIDVNKPSSSVVQERPIYTNISNGIGVFSSNRVVRINYVLNFMTVDSLKNGSLYDLNFR